MQILSKRCNRQSRTRIYVIWISKRMKITAQDFERLTTCQMEFAGNDGWVEQINRFDEEINWKHQFIYWVDTYVSALVAVQYLVDQKFDYSISYDEATADWVITTDYAGSWVTV